jgi:SAM-dependent methyltransferase
VVPHAGALLGGEQALGHRPERRPRALGVPRRGVGDVDGGIRAGEGVVEALARDDVDPPRAGHDHGVVPRPSEGINGVATHEPRPADHRDARAWGHILVPMPDPSSRDAERRFTALEAAGWSERASIYDRLTARITTILAEPLLDAAHVAAGTRVLDLGCGPGVVCGLAARRGALPTGVDVSPGMLAEARRRHPDLAFVEADAVALPFEDGAFDACVGGFVINHLPAPDAATGELTRSLAPGGALALSLWEPPAENRWLGIVGEALGEIGVPAPADLAGGPDPYRFADREEMIGLLRRAGLSDLRFERVETLARCRDSDEFWDGVLGGSVRTSTTILRQPEEVRRRVRAAVDRRLRAYRTPRGLELPARAVIGVGRR